MNNQPNFTDDEVTKYQNEETVTEAKKSNNAVRNAGIAAGVVGAAAVGTAAGYAATRLHDKTEEPAPAATDEEPRNEVQEPAAAEAPAAAAQHAPAASEPEPQPSPAPKGIDFNNADMSIDDVQATEMGGSPANVAVGQVDGQRAAFVDLGQDGTVDVIAVDANGNNEFEDNEVYDVSGQGFTMDGPQPEPQPTSNGPVITSIDQMADGTVMAQGVTAQGTAFVAADFDNDNYVDVLAVDANNNQQLEDDEIAVVSGTEYAVNMPTETGAWNPSGTESPAPSTYTASTTTDDTTGTTGMETAYGDNYDSNLPDYSNDADVQCYDV